MPSPFPGMDPWLEDPDIVRDLAFSFAVRLSESLNAVLPEKYYSRTVRHEWLEPSRRTPLEPVAVLPPAVECDGPFELPLDADFLEMYDLGLEVFRVAAPEHVRVAVVDVVSHEAKTAAGPVRELYIQRQRSHLWADVNRVEIDFWRTGSPLAPVSGRLLRQAMGGLGPSAYILRADRPATVTVYPFRYDRPLPVIPVPIDEAVGDVSVELQPVLDACYKGGAYDRRVDYTQPPQPPLTPDQQAWADEILRAKGLLP